TLNPETVESRPTAKGRMADERRRLHARQGGQASYRVLRKRVAWFGICVLRKGQLDFERQQLVRIEARINLLQTPEAPHQQPRANQQNQRQRDFGYDQSIAQAL